MTWHASTHEEEKEIRQSYGSNADIVVAQNIPTAQQLQLEDILEKRKTGVRRFLFISRIAKKKNLHLAVQAMRQIKTEYKAEFHIFGNIEDKDYFKKIEGDIKPYENITIEYRGPLNLL